MSAPYWTPVQHRYGLRLLRARGMNDDCLQEVFRSTASQSYNLQERKHNYSLPLRTGRLSDRNFIQRMLYLDVY